MWCGSAVGAILAGDLLHETLAADENVSSQFHQIKMLQDDL